MPTADERAQIAAITRELERTVEGAVRGIATDLQRELVEHTPAANGAARAGWRGSVGRPKAEPVPRNAAGVAKAKAAQAEGAAEVSGFKLGHGTAHVANAQGYIESLNDGHSRAEPSAFVQRAISTAVRRVRTRVR